MGHLDAKLAKLSTLLAERIGRGTVITGRVGRSKAIYVGWKCHIGSQIIKSEMIVPPDELELFSAAQYAEILGKISCEELQKAQRQEHGNDRSDQD